MDPNEVNLAHFVSVTCLDLSPGTANKYLTGIVFCLRDRFPFVVEARNSRRVKLSVQGCRKLYSVPVVRAKPFTIHDVHRCAKTFASSFDDQLFNTIIALGFAGLHRLGELTDNDSVALRVPRQIIRRSSLFISRCNTAATYILPYHKADKYYTSSPIVILNRKDDPTCPILTLIVYTLNRDRLFPANPYWLLREDGTVPTRSWFIARLNSIFEGSRTGLSLRTGGATALAQAGMPMETIQCIGRWSSEAYRTYIRNHPLMNVFASRLNPIMSGATIGEQLEFPGSALSRVPAHKTLSWFYT